ncbi:hypothetical protein AVEN_271260-1 [Araneus ventricosus]|uniref:Uncharacterized protein n=1 Tax=Araneus ventricosus TaxID=182803 RepID=A0A4Y2G3K5_ARAVE|nr:hypothetical protein AVEN_271260-1 [Araneus ventricosus]
MQLTVSSGTMRVQQIVTTQGDFYRHRGSVDEIEIYRTLNRFQESTTGIKTARLWLKVYSGSPQELAYPRISLIVTGSKNALFIKFQIPQSDTSELHTVCLLLSYRLLSLPPSSLLKPLPFRAQSSGRRINSQGFFSELDKSSNRTPAPTFQANHWKRSTRNSRLLSALFLEPIQTIPRRPPLNPRLTQIPGFA